MTPALWQKLEMVRAAKGFATVDEFWDYLNTKSAWWGESRWDFETVSLPMARRYHKGQAEPKVVYLQQIIKLFRDIDPEWLCGDSIESPMFRQPQA